MQDAGVEIRDARFRMRDKGWGGQDARCGMGRGLGFVVCGGDTGCEIQDAGHGMGDAGFEIQDAGYGILASCILYLASRILYLASRISHFRLELTSSSRGWHGVGGRLRGLGHGPWHLWRR